MYYAKLFGIVFLFGRIGFKEFLLKLKWTFFVFGFISFFFM